MGWITAPGADQIRKLLRRRKVERSLFDERGLMEIHSPDYPGERLIVSRNVLLADRRRRERAELLERTERELEKIAAAVNRKRRPLRGATRIAERVGRVINRYRMRKHFRWEIEDDRFVYWRDEQSIADEEQLDGLHVIRTSVEEGKLEGEEVVRAYKDLSLVEQAFRFCKTVDLHIRPVYHRLDDRIRAHVLLCMLAYYVEWHLRAAWRSILYEEDDPEGAEAGRESVVHKATRSDSARRKEGTKRNAEGQLVRSFRDLLRYLGTQKLNRVCLEDYPDYPWEQTTELRPQQETAFSLIEQFTP